MSGWEVVDKRDTTGGTFLKLVTGGIAGDIGAVDHLYVVRNRETGDTKIVIAHDSYDIGDSISEGDFSEINGE